MNVAFSGWFARRPFPDSIFAAAMVGTTRIAVGSGGTVVTSTDSVSWAGHPLPTRATLRGITVDTGSAIAVAVGEQGTILTTTDGAAWTSRTSGTLAKLQAVARGASAFVAVGAGGVILSSSDSITWTSRPSGTSNDLLSITYGASRFVAVGYAGTILTSPDGQTWAAQASGTTQYLTGVAFDPKGFVAVGSGGAILTSPDATTWTSPSSGTTAALLGAAAYSGTYAVVNDAQTVFSSTDGINWAPHPTGGFAGTNAGIVALGADFHVLGLKGSIARSADAATWSLMLAPTGAGPQDARLMDATYGNSTWVVVGSFGSVFTSPDGAAWTSRRADGNGGIQSVAFGSSVFVAVATNAILRSSDGATWTAVGPAPGSYGGTVAYQAAKGFVVVTSDNTATVILTSPDGTNWTTQPGTGITKPLDAISCSASTCVAIGAGGTVYTHPSPGAGGAWTPRNFPVTDSLDTVEFGNSVFVVPTGTGTYTSADGATWSGLNPVTPPVFRVLGFGNGVFMSSGSMTSADGVAWTTTTGPWLRDNFNNSIVLSAAAYGGPAGWVGAGAIFTVSFPSGGGSFVFMTHP